MTDQTSARRLERRALLGMGLSLSAAAWLTGSDAARKWLDGPRSRDILGPDDRWTTK